MDASPTPIFNRGYTHLRGGDTGISLGLMLPIGPELGRGQMVPIQHSIDLARRAGRAGVGKAATLAPYAAWCSFATVLTETIRRRNS